MHRWRLQIKWNRRRFSCRCGLTSGRACARTSGERQPQLASCRDWGRVAKCERGGSDSGGTEAVRRQVESLRRDIIIKRRSSWRNRNSLVLKKWSRELAWMNQQLLLKVKWKNNNNKLDSMVLSVKDDETNNQQTYRPQKHFFQDNRKSRVWIDQNNDSPSCDVTMKSGLYVDQSSRFTWIEQSSRRRTRRRRRRWRVGARLWRVHTRRGEDPGSHKRLRSNISTLLFFFTFQKSKWTREE